ncbi:hypothetical protein O2N63_07290 [Aliiroseovarius sp. KMU-50]|uniref:Adenylosuccinate lyase n=1 Tax=Aliiroseovarius salicola TaxID=3009082 RepID=A0ABT4W2B5_9RHOB|nr:hypothetical protein [Aliiroseovarius sp. KMU-50]MDA5093888.1 hypothetical protein [Aliiroseovarius sp. KMU-50]
MFIRTLLASLVLVAASILTPAHACEQHQKQAQSCLTGYVWSDDAKTCVPEVTG